MARSRRIRWLPLAVLTTFPVVVAVGASAAHAQPTGADIGVSLLGPAGAVTPGDRATVVVTVSNDGESSASGVVLDLELPSGSALLAAVPRAGSCTVAGAGVRCDLGDLNPSTTVGVDLVLTTDPAAAEGSSGLLRATVTASSAEAAPGDESTVVDIVVGTPAASIRADGPSPVRIPAGRSSATAWQVRNDGPSTARAAVVVVHLPDGVTGAGEGCTSTLVGLWCSVGDLAPGEERSLYLMLTAGTTLAGSTLTANPPVLGDDADAALAITTLVTGGVTTQVAPAAQPSSTASAVPPVPADGGLPEALAFTGGPTDTLALLGGAALVLGGLSLGAAALVRRRAW